LPKSISRPCRKPKTTNKYNPTSSLNIKNKPTAATTNKAAYIGISVHNKTNTILNRRISANSPVFRLLFNKKPAVFIDTVY